MKGWQETHLLESFADHYHHCYIDPLEQIELRWLTASHAALNCTFLRLYICYLLFIAHIQKYTPKFYLLRSHIYYHRMLWFSSLQAFWIWLLSSNWTTMAECIRSQLNWGGQVRCESTVTNRSVRSKTHSVKERNNWTTTLATSLSEVWGPEHHK